MDAIHRRGFLKTGVLGSLAAAAGGLAARARGAATKPERDWVHGLKLGIASYSLRKFPLEETIKLTRQAGVKYICLKDVHLSMKSSAAELREAREKIEAGGLMLLGGGVIYLKNDAEEIRGAFEYAKGAGMPTMVCSPDPEALDLVEKAAKEYDLRIAIHNHGPGDKRYPSPRDVFRLVKDRDARMGLCMDIGHTVRLGEDPVAVIQECAGRLYDFHIKDVTQATAKGGAIAVGRGVIDIVAVLKTLVSLKYPYHLALEHEADADNPMPGIAESFGYLRGVLAAI